MATVKNHLRMVLIIYNWCCVHLIIHSNPAVTGSSCFLHICFIFSAILHSHRDPLPAIAYVFKSSTEPTRFLGHSARTCSWMHSPITNFLLIHLPGKNSLYNFQVLDSCMQFCEAGVFCRYTSSNVHCFSRLQCLPKKTLAQDSYYSFSSCC